MLLDVFLAEETRQLQQRIRITAHTLGFAVRIAFVEAVFALVAYASRIGCRNATVMRRGCFVVHNAAICTQQQSMRTFVCADNLLDFSSNSVLDTSSLKLVRG